MKNSKLLWSHQEYLAYILLYGAHADSQYLESEREHILSKIAKPIYERAFKEFELDNDYQRIQNIVRYQKANQFYSNERIIQEFKELFNADENFHQMEKYMLSLMQRILNAGELV